MQARQWRPSPEGCSHAEHRASLGRSCRRRGGADLIGWWLIDLTRGEPTPFVKPAIVDGRNLQVTYTGSRCQDGSRLDVDERTDHVVVMVYEWEYPTGCDDVGVPYTLTETLSDDLETEPWSTVPARCLGCRGTPTAWNTDWRAGSMAGYEPSETTCHAAYGHRSRAVHGVEE